MKSLSMNSLPIWVGRDRRARRLLALCAIVPLCLCSLSYASGISSLHSLESGSISVTNTQKNSSWHPIAILFRFEAPSSGTITVERRTGSISFPLTSRMISNSQHAIWIPEASIPFNLNDVLGITSTVTNGTTEIIRKAD